MVKEKGLPFLGKLCKVVWHSAFNENPPCHCVQQYVASNNTVLLTSPESTSRASASWKETSLSKGCRKDPLVKKLAAYTFFLCPVQFTLCSMATKLPVALLQQTVWLLSISFSFKFFSVSQIFKNPAFLSKLHLEE